MDELKFKEIEQKYYDLKEKLNQGEITTEDFKRELKKLMMLDENGNYWMLGGKSGKWYYHDGNDWQERNPYEFSKEQVQTGVYETSGENNGTDESEAGESPATETGAEAESKVSGLYSDHGTGSVEVGITTDQAVESKSAIPGQNGSTDIDTGIAHSDRVKDQEDGASIEVETGIDHGREMDKEKEEERIDTKSYSKDKSEEIRLELDQAGPDATDEDTVVCRVCRSDIPRGIDRCPTCGTIQKETSHRLDLKGPQAENEIELKSINKLSLLFFLSGFGLIVGVIFGAIFGIYPILGDLIDKFGPMLAETRGRFAGGLIFAALGGISGFITFAVFSLILAFIYDFISYIFGGIKIKIKS